MDTLLYTPRAAVAWWIEKWACDRTVARFNYSQSAVAKEAHRSVHLCSLLPNSVCSPVCVNICFTAQNRLNAEKLKTAVLVPDHAESRKSATKNHYSRAKY